jgi:hypothetical protein
MNPTINWDRPMLKRFQKAYADTKGFEDSYVFEFEGHQFVRSYAKFLLEYLESQLCK